MLVSVSVVVLTCLRYGLSGVRLLSSGAHTDLMEGAALSHSMQEVDIYSNSWGPYDNGVLVEGPGSLATRALYEGVHKVRLHI